MVGRNDGKLLFFDGDLGANLRSHLNKAQEIVETIPEPRFTSTSDEDLARDLEEQLAVVPLELLEEQRSMTKEEIKIEVSRDRSYDIRRGPVYLDGIRARISIPFCGDPLLWKLQPSTSRSTFPYGDVHAASGAREGIVEITIESLADRLDQIKQEYERILNDIRFYIGNQKTQIESELATLPSRVRAVIARRRDRLKRHDNLADVLGVPLQPKPQTEPILESHPEPATRKGSHKKRTASSHEWDVFVAHASEDKDGFVRPLAEALRARGFRVWFDEFTLRVGDSLRRSIDRGLAQSRFGVVVISPAFLSKEWPQKELDGLTAREVDGQKVILPVWHNVDVETVRRYSPTLADRIATSSAKGLAQVVDDLHAAIQGT